MFDEITQITKKTKLKIDIVKFSGILLKNIENPNLKQIGEKKHIFMLIGIIKDFITKDVFKTLPIELQEFAIKF